MPHPAIETMSSSEGLFPPMLIPEAVTDKLPEGYKLRALRETDFDTGFLECLRVLTTVGDITQGQFVEQFRKMKQQQDYYIVVIEDTNRTDRESSVVATGALIVEHKLYVFPPAPFRLPSRYPPTRGCCLEPWKVLMS